MIDLTQPYCTYRTTHPAGFIYEGKGITSKVASGAYQGSGIRFKLALGLPGYESDKWTTVILETFDTEEAAYQAEAVLVPIESLADPFRLNMNAGGLVGKYQNHSKLFKKINAARRTAARLERNERAKLKRTADKKRIRELKQQIKEQNGTNK